MHDHQKLRIILLLVIFMVIGIHLHKIKEEGKRKYQFMIVDPNECFIC